MAERWVTGTYAVSDDGRPGNGRKFRINMETVYCLERGTWGVEVEGADGKFKEWGKVDCTILNGCINGHQFYKIAVEMPEHFTDEKPIEYPRLDFNKPIGR